MSGYDRAGEPESLSMWEYENGFKFPVAKTSSNLILEPQEARFSGRPHQGILCRGSRPCHITR